MNPPSMAPPPTSLFPSLTRSGVNFKPLEIAEAQPFIDMELGELATATAAVETVAAEGAAVGMLGSLFLPIAVGAAAVTTVAAIAGGDHSEETKILEDPSDKRHNVCVALNNALCVDYPVGHNFPAGRVQYLKP